MSLQNIEQTFVDPQKTIDFSGLKIKKLGKDRAIFGPVNINFPLDDSFEVEGIMYIKRGGVYQPLPFKLPKKPLCVFINEEIFFLPKASNVSEITFPMTCPLEVVRKL